MSNLERIMAFHMDAIGLKYVREYRFHPVRRWRFDFAFPAQKVAVECEGGTWTNGRHTRGSGFEKDCHKYNAAAMEGWTVLRFTSGMINSGEAINQIEAALEDYKNEQSKGTARTDQGNGRFANDCISGHG